MELPKRVDQNLPERKGHKRKLEEEFEEERGISVPTGDAKRALLSEVSAQVEILNSTFSWKESDRAAAKRATHVLAELAKNGTLIYIFILIYRNALPILSCSYAYSSLSVVGVSSG